MLYQAYRRNHNGCGFVSDGHFYKGLNFQTFYQKLQRVSVDEMCIIHFRLATHGSVCDENCHPFMYGDLAFAHNGILNIQPIGDTTDSETAFYNVIVPVFERYGYDSPHFARAINRIIGYSKFALLYKGKLRTYGKYYKYGKYLCSNLHFINSIW